jgi:pyruvate dehydrogenase E2 component (dihydrolipoamide acetyltransferase)
MDEAAYTVKQLSPLRKVIAARMAEAKQTIPHFRLVAEIELDALLTLRKELRARRPQSDVSLNDFLIKAVADALIENPEVNVQWAQGEIRQYQSADISVVMAIEGGLSTPIIRRADAKSLWDISREVDELAARAMKNNLKMDEVFGGSFSISNLGMYGVDQFDAIINLPQCAILAVGRARPQFVVAPDHTPRVATVLRVTLSVDHRAIDGATAAAFLSTLRQKLEQPDNLLSEDDFAVNPRGALRNDDPNRCTPDDSSTG